tara:strand:+ start:280 stop:1002 length:723 start_codon:yes stop_codon:yes gene_type:complete
MYFRLVINVVLIIGCIVVVTGMINGEVIQGKKTETNYIYPDRLRDIRYSPSDRESNLRDFGLDEKMIKSTQKFVQKFESAQGDKRIKKVLQKIRKDQDAIRAVCGQNENIRPRYAVAPYLIKEENNRRVSVNIRRIKSVEFQEWISSAYLEEIYEHLELRKNPKVDTTKMFYGAVFLKKEDYILENTNPWGQGTSSWKWKGVLRDARDEKFPIEKELPQYFALMMMFIETAQGVDGVCEY